MIVREAGEEDAQSVMAVARSLSPGWFDRTAIGIAIPCDLKICRTHVAVEGGSVVGFITDSTEAERADIKWIGVRPEFQRRGIGTKLYSTLEGRLRDEGITEVRVDTVSEETEYEPYERTRAFYERMGFNVEGVRKTRSGETGEEFFLATYLKTLRQG